MLPLCQNVSANTLRHVYISTTTSTMWLILMLTGREMWAYNRCRETAWLQEDDWKTWRQENIQALLHLVFSKSWRRLWQFSSRCTPWITNPNKMYSIKTVKWTMCNLCSSGSILQKTTIRHFAYTLQSSAMQMSGVKPDLLEEYTPGVKSDSALMLSSLLTGVELKDYSLTSRFKK